jgi:hypothetical protein
LQPLRSAFATHGFHCAGEPGKARIALIQSEQECERAVVIAGLVERERVLPQVITQRTFQLGQGWIIGKQAREVIVRFIELAGRSEATCLVEEHFLEHANASNARPGNFKIFRWSI